MSEMQNRPLVTFALFAYNQEKYIREAVEAAFAQDYSPLEIIISDDRSTDGTFGIISDLASDYRGPHRVVARQSAENRGSLLHVAEVAGLAKGELLVLAAGDDISKKSRVGQLAAAWTKTGSWGLCSRYDRIDESGQVKERSVIAPVLQGDGLRCYLEEAEGPVPIVHGCTSAYDRRVFAHLQLNNNDYILAEDGALTILINLLGKKIFHLDDSLVLYRECEGSLTNSRRKRRPSFADIALDEGRIERLARAQANRCRLFLRMNEYLGPYQVRQLRVGNVLQELAIQEAKANWWKMPIGERMAFIARHPASKWALARFIGFGGFLFSKWLFRRIPYMRE